MALLLKMICNLGDPTSLRHPVHIHTLRLSVWPKSIHLASPPWFMTLMDDEWIWATHKSGG